MTKIAVLISGEYRKLDVCRKTMHFLNNPNVDIYISTWDKTTYSSPRINLCTEKIITPDIIRTDLNKDAIIEVESSTLTIEEKYNSKMIHRWLQGFKLIQQSGKSYDYVVVMRPDLFFNQCIGMFDSIEKYKDKIGFAWATSLHLGKLPDLLFVSSYKGVEKIFNSLSVNKWNRDKEPDWHIWWYNFVHNLFPDILNTDEMNYFTFCRYWVNNDNTFLDALNIHHDWRDLRLLHECDMWGEDFAKTAWPDEILINAKKKWNSGYFDKYKSNNL
jgi:hypothetical protein